MLHASCLDHTCALLVQEAIGPKIEAAYKNTTLKQERGKQIEAIKQEAHRLFDSASEQDLPLLKTAVDAVASSLGGLGGLGASSSKPEIAPDSTDDDDEEEVVDDTLKTNLAKNAIDFLPEGSQQRAASQQAQISGQESVPSIPPPDDAEVSTSGRNEADGVQEAAATALQVSRAIKVSYCSHADLLSHLP